MSRVAVFVDAGYLFAQGSVALTGSKASRTLLSLNETAVVAELTAAAKSKSENASLLRIYWYDGAIGSRGLTAEHSILAHTDYVKLRLGNMNSVGQQKGVDSLIVTDLIELARNHAISDALLLSGDEDVRIGVQIAQSFGVRIHLLGITPARGSQAITLLQEADTSTEWDRATVSKFLTVKPARAPAPLPAPGPAPSTGGTELPEAEGSLFADVDLANIERVAEYLVDGLDTTELNDLTLFWKSSSGVPREFDGRLLGYCRTEIKRDLSQAEKRHARAKFCEKAKARIPGC
ncbi:NYN domain-containing protein [Methylobacterium sp. E-046]|uniref:NYN domain-containing protein n=1 Tax=Methylobacterium sp. E-046 TaxID=2836576 RepID=UPI001FBB0EAB|nr:NYN domain-containing protein [Methylobacterium sp. E-046]MCJ2102492.1 NYN domain-containing protein [Methylobacterium sp. E-046]